MSSSAAFWLNVFYKASTCAFWLACAAFTGVCAAFFWRDVKMDALTHRRITLRSVVLTWVFTFPMYNSWLVLGWLYLPLFRFAVDRGITFWNSNRPREWIGDFSDMESDIPEE